MTYGTIKVDTVTFTNAGVDKSVTLSGLVQNPVFSGNVTVTGTLSGVTVTGTTANFTSGNFTNISGGTHTITSGVFAAGSAASPSITFTGDLNTGIYSPGADQVAISTGGSGRLFINSSGQVGIGTTANANLSLPNNANINFAGPVSYYDTNSAYSSAADRYIVNGAAARYIQNAGTHVWQYAASGTAGNAISFNEGMRLDSSGRLGVGTSSPSERLHVNGGNLLIQDFTPEILLRSPDGTSNRYFISANISDTGDGGIVIGEGANLDTGIQRLVINGSGNVGVGTTSVSELLHVSGTGDVKIKAATTSTGAGANAGLSLDASTEGNWLIQTGNAVSDGLRFYDVQASSERLRIDSSGRVGIGTSNPSTLLGLAGSSIISWGETNYPYIQGANSSNFIAFGTQATERARIDSSGRLLVGTSSAYTTSSGITPRTQFVGLSNEDCSHIIYNFQNDATTSNLTFAKARGGSVGTQGLVPESSTLGNIFFEASDGTQLRRAASILAAVDGTPGTNDMPGRLVFSTTADGASSPTERMRITNTGDVLIGTTTTGLANTTGFGLNNPSGVGSYINIGHSSGTASGFEYLGFSFNGSQIGSIRQSGTTAVTYNTTSDYRLKENLIPIANAIGRIASIPTYRFNFISEPERTVDGFIAHEVQAIVPEAVTGEKDAVDADGNPIYQGIDQSKLVPLLTAALQEAVAKIESLEARLTAAGI